MNMKETFQEAWEKSVVFLIKNKPFFAHFLQTMNRIITDEKVCPTLGVNITDRINLFINQKFFMSLKPSERVACLEHENLHILLKHLLRGKSKNQRIFNLASDISCNQYIQNLPKNAMLPEKFKLEREREAEYYYKKLMKNAKNICQGCPKNGKEGCPLNKQGQDEGGGTEGKDRKDDKGGKSDGRGNCEKTLDDHSLWGKGNKDKDYQHQIIKNAIRKTMDNTKDYGHLPSSILAEIRKALMHETANWRSILQRFIHRATLVNVVPTRKKMNRRYGFYYDGNRVECKLELLVGIDSVASWSPLLVQDNEGLIDILPISDIGKKWENLDGKREIAMTDYLIYSPPSKKQRWACFLKPTCLTRHKYKGKLIRVNTHGGVIDTSPNHSLIISNGSIVDARTVKIGQRLCVPRFQIDYTKLSDKSSPFFFGNEELAWLYGFFSAEGSAFFHNYSKSGRVEIVNSDYDKIEKTELILGKFFSCKIFVQKIRQDNTYHLVLHNKRAYRFFRDKFYTQEGEKKVPKEILNAPKNIRYAFLLGYNEGDGSLKVKRRPKPFSSFSTISQILAMGLLWLIKTTTNLDYIVFTRKDKPKVIQINFSEKSERAKQVIKKKFDFNYNGYVYDISINDERANHTFSAGLGLIKVHNTSGSISDNDLSLFFAEIEKIKALGMKITVAEIDAQVQKVYKYKNIPKIVSGRGGTEFRPLFELGKKLNPNAIIYLTDLYADLKFKNPCPAIPVLWAITEQGGNISDIPFGRGIKLKKDIGSV